MKRCIACGFLILLAACSGGEDSAAKPFQPRTTNARSVHTAAFDTGFGRILQAYYQLKDHFVAEDDSALINQNTDRLMKEVDSLPLAELSTDSSYTDTARTYALSLSSELKGLRGETSITEKRREFQMVSDQLYTLIRFTKYDRAVIYHHYCATAFPDQGAFWLSNMPTSKNPYAPRANCAEIKDSIEFGHY